MSLINEWKNQLPALPFKVFGRFYAIVESLGSIVYIIVIGGVEEAMFLLYLKPELFFPGKMYRASGNLHNRYR